MTNIALNIKIDNIHNYGLDVDNREIFVHSYIGESGEENLDYRCAILLEKNLRILNQISNKPILIHMHICGGDWEDCMGMYDAIRLSKSKIIIIAYAKVSSSSSVLFQAADTRIMMPNTSMLIHYGSISFEGEHTKAASSSITWNNNESEKMIDIFTEKCINGQLAKDRNWKKMMARKHIISQLDNKGDWILSAEESVYYGFCDGVLGSRKYPSIEKLKYRKHEN